jgi:predicted porin
MKQAMLAAALLSLGASAAGAQQAVTVKNLLAQDFAVVGSISSNAGPGVFLQKKGKLFLCFVAETPNSTAVATRYCKPVE